MVMALKDRGHPSGPIMYLLGTVILLLPSVFCQAQEQSPLCSADVEGINLDITCTNITDFSTVTDLTSADKKVVLLKISQSPHLVITRSDLDHPVFEDLAKLHLVGNEKKTFDPEPFSGLTHLKHLDLRENNLTSINSDTFSGLSSVQKLILSDNQITTIADDAFQVLYNLTVLELSRNRLTSLGANLFEGSNLLGLSLTGNLLTSIDKDSFKGLNKLITLELENNRIKTIDSRAFQTLGSLQLVQLRRNQLESLDARLLENTSIIVLDLSGNILENLSNFPLNSSTLRGLGLHNGKIQTIPAGYFNNIPNLVLLDLSWNNLTEIDANFLTPLPKLRTINLDHNKLVSLSVASFDQFNRVLNQEVTEDRWFGPQMAGISMYNNPWNCSTQDMIELRQQESAFDEIFDCNLNAN